MASRKVPAGSAFFWLVTLILVALLWRPFIPLGASPWPYIPLLLTAVGIQEAARLLFWQICMRLEAGLEAIAVAQSRPRLSVLDKFEISLAVASLAFLLLHTFGMVVAFDGYATRTKSHQLAVPALHLTAALLMLVNFAPGGCAAGVSLVWICAAAMIALCARAAWERTGHSITLDTPLRPPRPRPPGS
eukprot:jgi/Mesen1/8379/ME000468S07810